MPEPLKGKLREIWTKNGQYVVIRDGKRIIRFVNEEDIKSAVQGLLEEIEELRQNKIEQSEDYHSRDKNFRRICSCECCSMVSAYTNCINLIKKWLADAVVEDELD